MSGNRYTVKDTQSGKSVTFDWNHPTAPTDADFEEVFKAAGYRGGDNSIQTPYTPGQMQDTRSAEAKIPNETRPTIPTPKTTAALNPFSTIGKAVGFPAAGAVVDAALPQARLLANTVKTGLSATQAPDIPTGILRGAQALGEGTMAGLSALHPAGFAQFGGATEAASQISPPVARVLPKIFNPIQSLTNPQTQFGQELAKTGDIAGQVGLASLASTKGMTQEIGKRVIPETLPQRLAARAGMFKGSPEQVLKKAEISLREGINPRNIKSVEKLDNAISQIDKDITDYGNSADKIKTDDIVSKVQELRDKVSKRELAPQKSLDEINGIVERLYKERGQEIPADLAHQLKKGIYEREKAAYNAQELTGKLPDIQTHTEMKIASGILDEWKKLYPETEKMLSRQADLLNIRGDIRKSVRAEMLRSRLPESLLLALSPKWWLTKTIATNKSLEYGLGRLLYRARGGNSNAPVDKYVRTPPFDQKELDRINTSGLTSFERTMLQNKYGQNLSDVELAQTANRREGGFLNELPDSRLQQLKQEGKITQEDIDQASNDVKRFGGKINRQYRKKP